MPGGKRHRVCCLPLSSSCIASPSVSTESVTMKEDKTSMARTNATYKSKVRASQGKSLTSQQRTRRQTFITLPWILNRQGTGR